MTWTLPVDHVVGFWFVNTSYYLSLSTIVSSYWEETFDDTIIRSVTALAELRDILGRFGGFDSEEVEVKFEEEEALSMG